MAGNRKGLFGLTLNSLPDNPWLAQPANNMLSTPLGTVGVDNNDGKSFVPNVGPSIGQAGDSPVGSLGPAPSVAESMANFNATPTATPTPVAPEPSMLGSFGAGDILNLGMMGAKFAAQGMGGRQEQDMAPPAPVAPPINAPSSAESADMLEKLRTSRIGALGGAAGGLGRFGGLGGLGGMGQGNSAWQKPFSSLRG